jgi:hypothetical protein
MRCTSLEFGSNDPDFWITGPELASNSCNNISTTLQQVLLFEQAGSRSKLCSKTSTFAVSKLSAINALEFHYVDIISYFENGCMKNELKAEVNGEGNGCQV